MLLINASNSKELKYNAYKKIYGETEARQVTRNRLFDEELLKLSQPDMSGNTIDATVEAEYIRLFQRSLLTITKKQHQTKQKT